MNKKLLAFIGIIVVILAVIVVVRPHSAQKPKDDIKIGFFGHYQAKLHRMENPHSAD